MSPAEPLAIPVHEEVGASALSAGPPSLADFRALLCRLTAQQRSIAAMKQQARPKLLCWSTALHRQVHEPCMHPMTGMLSSLLPAWSVVQHLPGGSMPGSQVRAAILKAQDTVGTLRLALARLQAALAPAPQRLLAELHKRLPALAAMRYERLSESIHSATAWLRQRPASTEEAVERLTFLVELQVVSAPGIRVAHFTCTTSTYVVPIQTRSTQKIYSVFV